MTEMRNPGALAGATGVGMLVHGKADGPHPIARKTREGTSYRVTPSAGEPFVIAVSGRDRWALERLRAAGPKGITSFSNPAPRLSAYIHNLRELGVQIETVTEPHGGEFAGHHGRYILRCHVAPDGKGGAA